MTDQFDAVVIGSGPNGLVAAATLARSGWDVAVLERAPVSGGSVRSDALTAPGYVHDTHSAFYGLLHASPVFDDLRLGDHVTWCRHATSVAAVTEPGEAATIGRDVETTVAGLDARHDGDGRAWVELHEWWERMGTRLLATILSPLGSPGPALRFLRAAGIRGAVETTRMQLAPVEAVARQRFDDVTARALVACGATHTDLGVDMAGTTPPALILAMVAQDHGMPVPEGGAASLARALTNAVTEAGGRVVTGTEVRRVLVERGRATGVETADGTVVRARRAVLADTAIETLAHRLVGEESLPAAYLDGLRRFRRGTGVFKIDLALAGPVPWAAEGLQDCGVVHVCGNLDTMARASFEARRGLLPAEPALVVGQQSVADPTRAPAGGHTLWVETHVPSVVDGDGAGILGPGPWPALREEFAARVLDRIEKHAPGFKERIVGVAVRSPLDLEADNPNLVGGDIAGGATGLDQQLVFRPVPGWFRYRTPVHRLYLCSASAHPGGGVHGMVGRNCARRVLRDARLRRHR